MPRSHSRTGAITLSSGSSAIMEVSKRTWSLPLPVQPWATHVAPYLWATSTRCLEMSGRERAESSGYLFSYMALAAMAQVRYVFANSSVMSTTSTATQPSCFALAATFSRPSCS